MAQERNSNVGNLLYLAWTPSGGSTHILSTYFSNFDAGFSTDVKENTTGGNELGSEQIIRQRVKPKASIIWESDDATFDALKAAIAQKTSGTLVWGYEGNGPGKPKWGILAQISMMNAPMKHDDLVTIELEWINRGDTFVYDGNEDTF